MILLAHLLGAGWGYRLSGMLPEEQAIAEIKHAIEAKPPQGRDHLGRGGHPGWKAEAFVQ